MTLYDALKARTRQTADDLSMPLGWEGEVFTPPHAPHLRARVVFTERRMATLGANGLTRTDGRLEIRAVTPAGEDSPAAELAARLARLFPRGESLDFENGTATLTTARIFAPEADGRRAEAVLHIPFYAFTTD